MGQNRRKSRYVNFSKVKTTEEAEERIKLWYEEEDVPTITGLALYLGCSDKSELYVLKQKPEFSDLIKTAALHVEHNAEIGLNSNDKIGCIFLLKNFGWSDGPAQQINIGYAANGLPMQINEAQQQALQQARVQTLEAPSNVGQEYFE